MNDSVQKKKLKRRTSNELTKILINEFTLRNSKNPKYSLRAFAQSIGADHSYIARLFAGKRGLSYKKFLQMAYSGRISEKKFQHLFDGTDLVDGSLESKNDLLKVPSKKQHNLMVDFRSGILVGIICVLKPKYDFKEIAKATGYSVTDVKGILEEAIKLGLLFVDDEGIIKGVHDGSYSLPTEIEENSESKHMKAIAEGLLTSLNHIKKRQEGKASSESSFHTNILFDHRKDLFDSELKSKLMHSEIQLFKKFFNKNDDSKPKKKTTKRATYLWSLSVVPTWEEK